VPLVVVGHSMGGGVALAAAARGLAADALVLAGPAIAGGAALNPAMRAGGWAIATVAPDRRWTGRGVVGSSPPTTARRSRRGARPRPLRRPVEPGALRPRPRHGPRRGGAPGHPADADADGRRDEVLRPARVRAVHDRIPGGAGYIEYPDGWHWLFRDRQAERVWSDVAAFVLSAAG
jgi:acylglycerol lipase